MATWLDNNFSTCVRIFYKVKFGNLNFALQFKFPFNDYKSIAYHLQWAVKLQQVGSSMATANNYMVTLFWFITSLIVATTIIRRFILFNKY